MGGFVLCDKDDVITETLSIQRLEKLESEGKIRWPSISEREIKDRSKADIFSKGFAVLQTTWFIVQCIARRVYGLTITELELVTFTLALLNGILYFLWWNKPLDVACPVPVPLLKQPADSEDGETLDRDDLCDPVSTPLIPRSGSEELNTPLLATTVPLLTQLTDSEDTRETHVSSNLCEPSTTPLVPKSSFEELNIEDAPELITINLMTWLSELVFSSTTSSKHPPASAFARYCRRFKDVTLFPLRMLWLPLKSMAVCNSIIVDDAGNPRAPLSVPTFYSPLVVEGSMIVRQIIVQVYLLFCWIHLDGWFFQLDFPSVQERYIWTCSAGTAQAIVAVFFLFLNVYMAFGWIGKNVKWMAGPIDLCFGEYALQHIWSWIGRVCIILYFVTRAVLLTLALIALRSFSPGSLININWSSFIPHIG